MTLDPTTRAEIEAALTKPHDESGGYHSRDCYVCTEQSALLRTHARALLDAAGEAERWRIKYERLLAAVEKEPL